MFQHKLYSRILVLLMFDLTTKYLFFDLSLLPSIFSANLNTGTGFGMGVSQPIIRLISIVALIVVLYYTRKQQIHPITGGLLLAGLIGNLLDRLFLDCE